MSTISRFLTAAATSGLLALGACGTYDGPRTISAAEAARDEVEVTDAVIVADSRGAATLVATVRNGTGGDLGLHDATIVGHDDVVIFENSDGSIPADQETSIGRIDGPYSVRILEGVQPGMQMTVTLTFSRSDGPDDEPPPATLSVPVVARSPANDDLLGVPADAIKVKDAVIVVVPGQQRAYVGGSIVSKIDDTSWPLPTAADAQGKPVKYRHQTATGGPSGFLARKAGPTAFGGPPYRVPDPDLLGDADYFNAADVTVGETITVTIPFESGDVVASFKVVAG